MERAVASQRATSLTPTKKNGSPVPVRLHTSSRTLRALHET